MTLTQRLLRGETRALTVEDRRVTLRGMKRNIKTNGKTKPNLMLDRQTIKELTLDQIAAVAGGNASWTRQK